MKITIFICLFVLGFGLICLSFSSISIYQVDFRLFNGLFRAKRVHIDRTMADKIMGISELTDAEKNDLATSLAVAVISDSGLALSVSLNI